MRPKSFIVRGAPAQHGAGLARLFPSAAHAGGLLRLSPPGPSGCPHSCACGPAAHSPQPSAELSVLPWMWVAAMPVAAVTATRCANSAPNSPRRSSMMAFSRKDLPVPASPAPGGQGRAGAHAWLRVW